ncbi:MAG: YceD family protein [Thermincolia bacterium]
MLIDTTKIRHLSGQAIPLSIQGNLEPIVIGGEVLTLDGPVEVKGEIYNTGRTYLVTGAITSHLQRVCGRCLKTFTDTIQTEMGVEYCHVSEVREDDQVEQLEDFVVFEGNSIDLTERVTESLYLAIPMRVLCAEDCQGMCSQCGQDLNLGKCQCETEVVDHRMKVLEKLLKTKN